MTPLRLFKFLLVSLFLAATAYAVVDFTDYGVVFYMTGDGSGSYKDITGATKSAGTLTSSYPGADSGTGYSIVHLSSATRAAATVHIVRSGATTVTVKCQARRVDANNPSLFTAWAPVQTVRSDTASAGYEQSFATTDPADIRLLTGDISFSRDFRCIAKAAGTLVSADLVAIGINAL